jgi:hypothetical protein
MSSTRTRSTRKPRNVAAVEVQNVAPLSQSQNAETAPAPRVKFANQYAAKLSTLSPAEVSAEVERITRNNETADNTDAMLAQREAWLLEHYDADVIKQVAALVSKTDGLTHRVDVNGVIFKQSRNGNATAIGYITEDGTRTRIQPGLTSTTVKLARAQKKASRARKLAQANDTLDLLA